MRNDTTQKCDTQEIIKITPKVLEDLTQSHAFKNAVAVYCPKRKPGDGFWYEGKRYEF